MPESLRKWGLLAIKALLTAAFAAAGVFKLIGADPMVQTFDAIGWGQWFRYLTGVVEVGAVILLWLPGSAALGAALLLATMVCAVLFHIFVLGPSLIPATLLGLLAAIVLWANKDQIPGARTPDDA